LLPGLAASYRSQSKPGSHPRKWDGNKVDTFMAATALVNAGWSSLGALDCKLGIFFFEQLQARELQLVMSSLLDFASSGSRWFPMASEAMVRATAASNAATSHGDPRWPRE